MNYYNQEGLAVCQICNKAFHFITANHLNTHGTTAKEYHERYPGASLFRKDFYDKPGRTKKKKFIPAEPVIEELSGSDVDDNFGDDGILTELSKCKLKTSSGPKRTDPMEDKLDIIGYLKSQFTGIKNNFLITKMLPNGSLEYQYITDMADPTNKILFEFPRAFWHNSQIGVSEHVKHQNLKLRGWRVIIVNATMPRIKDVVEELNQRKI